MAKQTKTQDEPRKPGPKFGRSVLPDNFQIRRSPSPMAELLEDAERRGMADASHTPENITPVNIAPVEDSLVSASRQENFLPEISVFLDIILPRFPPAR